MKAPAKKRRYTGLKIEIRLQQCTSACNEGEALPAGDLHKNARDGAS